LQWRPIGTILKDPVLNAETDILRYLIAHQGARDTIEGIEKWWLPQSREYGIADIAAALFRLEDRGLISIWKSVSAHPVYGLRAGAEEHSLDDYLGSPG
jgi:hypothetical protein